MIVVDIETSGGDFYKCGILQIGALDLENLDNTFFQEARLGEDNEIVEAKNLVNPLSVSKIVGMSEEEMRKGKKQSEKELLKKFFDWCKQAKIKNLVCHNPQFDYSFLSVKAEKYGLKLPFYHRAMDLSTIALVRYLQIHGKFLIKEDYTDMGLKNVLKLVGMTDERTIHNALEDAKLEAECFYRLIYGKNLLPEYSEFPVPKELKK